MAIITGNNVLEGTRQRLGPNAGVAGDTTGYGPYVYAGTASGGTPSAGTSGFGAGTAQPGALLIATATPVTAKVFVNTGTALASPTWTVLGSQS